MENVRRALNDDIPRLILLRQKLAQETDFLLPSPEELFCPNSRDGVIFRDIISKGVDLFLVSEAADNLSGFLLCRRNSAEKMKHTASLVVGVLKSFWGTGSATELFQHMFDWASMNEIERIELSVIEENLRAINFYKKHGFVEEGVRRNSIRQNDQYCNEIYMSRLAPF